ncbi:MAG: thermosome subunit [Candidatus Helarchaeota archaeon]|nr:thermosome subunit [Candidatus Helarchaeota archaeon]
MEFAGRPTLIMKKTTQRMKGTEAQRFNILSACIIAELIRTTLGPHGFQKLIRDPVGDIIISQDGGTIMKNYDVRHPMAKIMDKLVRSMETEVGDGTKTAMILVGELLKKGQIELMDQGVHPSQIISGYQIAVKKVNEIAEKIALSIDPDDENTLLSLAKTCFTRKFLPELEQKFAEFALQTIKYIIEQKNGENIIDIKNNVNMITIHGGSIVETELIKGMAIKKDFVSPLMPKRIENAKIAVLEPSLELKTTKIKAKIRTKGLKQLKAFRDEDYNLLKEKADKVIQSGANVVFARREVHDKIAPYLINAGIIAAKWVRGWDMEKIAKATGAKVVKNLDFFTPDTLGEAGIVEEIKHGKEKVIYVRNCKNPKAVTIVIRGGIEHILYEIERKLSDALYVIKNAIENKKIVGGAGAFETELARQLRKYAIKFSGREQLSIQAYAKALEIIPHTLIENAGLNVLDGLAALRKKHEEDSDNSKWFGVDINSIKPINTFSAGILDSLKIKLAAINAATEVVNLILGIDDVIYGLPGEYEKTIEEEEAEEEYQRKLEEMEEYKMSMGKKTKK